MFPCLSEVTEVMEVVVVCLGRMCGDTLEELDTVYTTPGDTVAIDIDTTPVAKVTFVGV